MKIFNIVNWGHSINEQGEEERNLLFPLAQFVTVVAASFEEAAVKITGRPGEYRSTTYKDLYGAKKQYNEYCLKILPEDFKEIIVDNNTSSVSVWEVKMGPFSMISRKPITAFLAILESGIFD